MPTITERAEYGAARARIERLGLGPLISEIEQIVTGFELRVKEEIDANGAAAVRKLIDERFARAGDWKPTKSGGVDWTKCGVVNGTRRDLRSRHDRRRRHRRHAR